VVAGVRPGGPADRAGMRRGDTILSVDGKPVRSTDDLATILATLKPGQRVPVGVRRPNGEETTLQVRLGERPG
jgi:putative serine protease PepD